MIKKHFANKNFVKFLLAGGIAAGVNFFSRMGLGVFMGYVSSIIVAYILGMITIYILCRWFIFQSKVNTRAKEIFYFIIVNAFGILQTVIVTVFLAHHVFIFFIHDQFMREELAHLIGIGVPAFTSYLGYKYFSFK